jgi:hypothetical protein
MQCFVPRLRNLLVSGFIGQLVGENRPACVAFAVHIESVVRRVVWMTHILIAPSV